MNSIRRQLTLTLLPGFALLLVGSSAAIYFFTRAALLNEFDTGLRAQALTIMSLAEQGRDGFQFELPDNFFAGLAHDSTPRFYQLWQTNGTTIARSETLNDTNLPRPSLSESGTAFWNLALPDGHAGRAIALRFTPKAEDEDKKISAAHEAILAVAADREALDQTLATLATVLATSSFLAIIITVPLVNFSLRRGHAPLEQLARQTAAITADSLQTRFPVDSPPRRIAPHFARLNDLLSRLQSSFDRERRFSADLAHELRTPLAELRSHAEVALEWPEGEAAEKHRDTLNIALQMEALVSRLLELTRCENGKISPHLESVPLAPLIEEVWQPLARKAIARHLDIQFHIPTDVTIQTDRTLFRSILVNLLSNAVEYTRENGRGEIRWTGDRAELTVSNTVHDLTAADVPHLFERLWRKDKSRTGNTHSGLGLAVSRAFAELLGYNLNAHLNGQETLTLSLKTRRN